MPSPTHNPFAIKIFPATPFNSKISTGNYPLTTSRTNGILFLP
jgi:hypothetical protein